jgi:N-acetylglucosaminyldiphosphoundecaprenol N-acetyl-beta-D-mannosaminyltransferase
VVEKSKKRKILKCGLLGIFVSLGKFGNFVNDIIELAKKRESSYVCFANVDMCIETYRRSELANILNNSDITIPDDKPVVKALNWLYNFRQEKVSRQDLIHELLKSAEKEGLKVFFYGYTDYILEKLDNFCSYNYPKLALAGTFSPPHRALSYEEEIADVDRINNSGANMVLVSMGCPRQERWMAGMKGKIDAVMIGVGGAFSLLDGEEKQAPIWMQRNGLEWFYRLIQDPKRQIKRYWITNIEFKRLVFIEKYKTIR